MNRLLTIMCCVLFFTGVASAQPPGYIGIYSNPGGSDCNLYDLPFQVVSFYVVHVNTPGAQAARFSAPIPSCMTGATLLEEITMWPIKIGLVQEGTQVGYGGCLSSPIHVMTLQIFGQGLTADCCFYPVLGDPSSESGEIEVQLCDDTWVTTNGTPAIVNPNPSCYCIIPVGHSTWGKIKSLFVE